MCHDELWPTSVSHPFSSLNSSLGFAGGKHYQKITIPIFRLFLQNFAIPGYFPYILFYRYLFTRGQFWPSGIVIACVCLCVRQSWACLHDNSSQVWARITKFGPKMQNILLKVPIVLGTDWAWPSRSNFTLLKNSVSLHRFCIFEIFVRHDCRIFHIPHGSAHIVWLPHARRQGHAIDCETV